MTTAATVGSLLAEIANGLSGALRMMMFADKRQWGPDEFEQVRALEDALDEAKRDFQQLAVLVNGQYYYENDRNADSIHELRELREKTEAHTQNFKHWLRTGGPINPIWARETGMLKGELHKAQCRAAGRIFACGQELAGTRCLGAFQIYRQQRRDAAERQRQRGHERGPSLTSLEDLVPICNTVGKFERFGQHDAAFVCDFCDGYIVWKDLDSVPAERKPVPGTGSATAASSSSAAEAGAEYPNWQASGLTVTTGEEKDIVFAPLAIANHMPPANGEFQARLLCPYCADYTYVDQGDADEEDLRYVQDEGGFPSLSAFQNHLEWSHTALPASIAETATRCVAM